MTNKDIITEGRRLTLDIAVSSFYALKAVEASPAWRQGDLFLRSRELFEERFKTYTREFTKKLAQTLFDYLALAAFGEARRAAYSAVEGTVIADFHRMESRRYTYIAATQYDPKKFLPILADLFDNSDAFTSGSCMGGRLWGDIARAAMMYYTHPLDVFIDHVIDLEHNGGLCFNKGILVRVDDEGRYYDMLNRKKLQPIYSGGDLDADTAEVIRQAEVLGLVEFTRYTYFIEDVRLKFPEPIKWGKKSIFIRGTRNVKKKTQKRVRELSVAA